MSYGFIPELTAYTDDDGSDELTEDQLVSIMTVTKNALSSSSQAFGVGGCGIGGQ